MICGPRPASAKYSISPNPGGIVTFTLESPEVKVGVELYDATIGSNSYPAVRSVAANSAASNAGVSKGMIVLDRRRASDVVRRIKNGPYPVVLQFYNLAAEGPSSPTKDAEESLADAQKRAEKDVVAMKRGEAELLPLPKGTGLITKIVRKGTGKELLCAKRGDEVTIQYEARVASAGGPLYDSTDERRNPIAFTLGKQEAVSGVDIGVNGMCVGEVRTIDIPSVLGYGRAGAPVFDIPGDVRLWWKIELLDIKKRR